MSLHQTNLWNGGLFSDYLVFNQGKYLGVLTEEMFNQMARPMAGAPRGAVAKDGYNTAFLYNKREEIIPGNFANKRWWRLDGTPRLKEDIPKDYLTMVLLLV